MQGASTFGRRLRALRLAQEMSQVELARRIGRHQTAIGPYERDEYEPPRDVVEKLALGAGYQPGIPLFRPQPAARDAARGRPARRGAGCWSRRPEVPGDGEPARPAATRLPRPRRQHGAGVQAGADRLGARRRRRAAPRRSWAATPWSSCSTAACCCAGCCRAATPAATILPPTMRRPYPWWECASQIHCRCALAGGLARGSVQASSQENIPYS